MVFIWGHLEAILTLTSQKPWISIFHKTPHQAIWLSRDTPTNLAMCKTHPTQTFRAPKLSWYSFRIILRPFQPWHLINQKFHFFTKHQTKQSSYVVPYRQTGLCAKPTQLKTFLHQDIHGIHLGTFGGYSNLHISKTMNFNFSQNSPPSHLPTSWHTAKLGHLRNPPTTKLLFTKTFVVLR